MIVSQGPRWMWLLAHASFVLSLSTPAYLAAVDALTSRGIGPSWPHRAVAAALCLAVAAGIMILPGITSAALLRIARHIRGRPGRGGISSSPGTR